MSEQDRLLAATHEARLKIAREYMDGLRDHEALNGVMVRLLLASLETEHAMKRATHR